MISFIPIVGEAIGVCIPFILFIPLGECFDRYVLKPLLEKIQKFNCKDIKAGKKLKSLFEKLRITKQ